MSGFLQRLKSHGESKGKAQSNEMKEASKSDSDITQVLDFADKEYKVIC